jgi:hypothetical protein
LNSRDRSQRKARREPLELEIVVSEEDVDIEAFLHRYIAALLAEVRREDASQNTRHVEGRENETPDLEPEPARTGLLTNT